MKKGRLLDAVSPKKANPLFTTDRQVGMCRPMKKPHAKQRILDTAADLFSDRGYSSVGINEIIEKSETAKASFYQHFPSKEQLCVTWLTDAHERSKAGHEAILNGPGNASEKVIAYFEDLKEWIKTKDFRGCPFTNTTAGLDGESPPISEQVEHYKLSIRDFFIDLANDIAPADSAARRLGTMFFLLYSGATSESQNLRSAWPVDAAIESVHWILAKESAKSPNQSL